MAKLTRKQTEKLTNIIHYIGKARIFIDDKRTVVGVLRDKATTATDFTRHDSASAIDGLEGSSVSCINKLYGFDLVYLWVAYDELSSLLESDGARG